MIGDLRVLVDCGSGFGDSDAMLDDGLDTLRREYGEPAAWSDLTHILITHGHIDHFGGLQHARRMCQAQVGIHELDLRILTHYEDRLAVTARRLMDFFLDAGVPAPEREELRELYLLNKHLFHSVQVDLTFHARNMQVGPIRAHHVPGHGAGHVVLLVDDVLLAGDHVLKGVSPHLAPERLQPSTGLTHYLASLGKVLRLSPNVRLTLGGHGDPIEDLPARIDAILGLHWLRLQRVLELASTPVTVAEVSAGLFPQADGYHRLLAVEEAAAHVEFLSLHGYLGVSVPTDAGSALRYARADRLAPQLPPLRAWASTEVSVVDPEPSVIRQEDS
jgi:glyoxylase-like metal-dependent hydrolase (beta-lactamase superfamily II)